MENVLYAQFLTPINFQFARLHSTTAHNTKSYKKQLCQQQQFLPWFSLLFFALSAALWYALDFLLTFALAAARAMSLAVAASASAGVTVRVRGVVTLGVSTLVLGALVLLDAALTCAGSSLTLTFLDRVLLRFVVETAVGKSSAWGHSLAFFVFAGARVLVSTSLTFFFPFLVFFPSTLVFRFFGSGSVSRPVATPSLLWTSVSVMPTVEKPHAAAEGRPLLLAAGSSVLQTFLDLFLLVSCSGCIVIFAGVSVLGFRARRFVGSVGSAGSLGFRARRFVGSVGSAGSPPGLLGCDRSADSAFLVFFLPLGFWGHWVAAGTNSLSFMHPGRWSAVMSFSPSSWSATCSYGPRAIMGYFYIKIFRIYIYATSNDNIIYNVCVRVKVVT